MTGIQIFGLICLTFLVYQAALAARSSVMSTHKKHS